MNVMRMQVSSNNGVFPKPDRIAQSRFRQNLGRLIQKLWEEVWHQWEQWDHRNKVVDMHENPVTIE
jgi:hypothetical protein